MDEYIRWICFIRLHVFRSFLLCLAVLSHIIEL